VSSESPSSSMANPPGKTLAEADFVEARVLLVEGPADAEAEADVAALKLLEAFFCAPRVLLDGGPSKSSISID